MYLLKNKIISYVFETIFETNFILCGKDYF
jgi:hypothetical protein